MEKKPKNLIRNIVNIKEMHKPTRMKCKHRLPASIGIANIIEKTI